MENNAAKSKNRDWHFKPYAFFRLIRPVNGLITIFSVIMGAYLASGSIIPTAPAMIAAIVAFLLLSAGNALNDFCDVEADRINKKERPIPSGQVERRSALIFAIILFVAGIGLGLLISSMAFIIACAVSVSLILYTFVLRRIIFVGNLLVGALTGLTFIYGGIAVGKVSGTLIPAIFAFLFTVAREIVKDIQDVKGDSPSRLSSLAIKLGNKRAMYVAFAFFALTILASPLPYYYDIYSIYYLICVILGVDLILLGCIALMLFNPTDKGAAKVASIMKIDIFVGLGAICLGGIN